MLDKLNQDLKTLSAITYYGRVLSIKGGVVEVEGLCLGIAVGDYCKIYNRAKEKLEGEIISIAEGKACVMCYKPLEGVGIYDRVEFFPYLFSIFPHPSWLGNVFNALGENLSENKKIYQGSLPYFLKEKALPAHLRQRVHARLNVGVRSINTFVPCCVGQRMGIFAGSGVGKSLLLGMLVKYAQCDVIVLAMIGERGREVREFLEDILGKEGMQRAVVVLATSDESPLMRRQAAYMATAVAEYFRDQGKEVLLLMDSFTRFAMAQREIGLAAGEMPASRGYPASVFSEFPKILERAGPGLAGQGNITALYTILVEGEDFNEPVTDAVRGILDGHIILDRKIAERGRYPAVDILKSISRMAPKCYLKEEAELVAVAKKLMARYADMEELIRIGAYKEGSNQEVDLAIQYAEQFEDFLMQSSQEYTGIKEGFAQLKKILSPVMKVLRAEKQKNETDSKMLKKETEISMPPPKVPSV